MQAWGLCQPSGGPPATSIPTGFAQGHSEIVESLMLQMQAAQFRSLGRSQLGKERNKLSTQLGGVYACFGHLSLIFVVPLADAEALWTVGMHWGALSQCSHKKGGKKGLAVQCGRDVCSAAQHIAAA